MKLNQQGWRKRALRWDRSRKEMNIIAFQMKNIIPQTIEKNQPIQTLDTVLALKTKGTAKRF